MTLRVQETIIVKRDFICVSFICINRGFIIKRAFCTKNIVCSRSTFYYISGFFVILCFFIPTQRKTARLRSELFFFRCSPTLFSQRIDLLGTRQRGIEPLEHKLKDGITLAATGRVKL